MAQARRKGIANSRYINEFMKLNTRAMRAWFSKAAAAARFEVAWVLSHPKEWLAAVAAEDRQNAAAVKRKIDVGQHAAVVPIAVGGVMNFKLHGGL